LDHCITKIETAYSEIGRNAVPAETLATALGFKSLSGASRPLLASLSYYGLLERVGHTHKVSDLALRIIRPVSDADKVAAIKQARLEPKLVAQIDQEHPDCSETVLASLLIRKGFTEDGAKRAAKIFKDNLEFVAKLGNTSEQEKPNAEPPKPPAGKNVGAPTAGIPKQSMPPPAITANELPVPIGENLIARIPFPMSAEDFDLFIGTLNLWKKKLIKSPPPTEPVKQETTHKTDDE
jgi:hypothetical protein